MAERVDGSSFTKTSVVYTAKTAGGTVFYAPRTRPIPTAVQQCSAHPAAPRKGLFFQDCPPSNDIHGAPNPGWPPRPPGKIFWWCAEGCLVALHHKPILLVDSFGGYCWWSKTSLSVMSSSTVIDAAVGASGYGEGKSGQLCVPSARAPDGISRKGTHNQLDTTYNIRWSVPSSGFEVPQSGLRPEPGPSPKGRSVLLSYWGMGSKGRHADSWPRFSACRPAYLLGRCRQLPLLFTFIRIQSGANPLPPWGSENKVSDGDLGGLCVPGVQSAHVSKNTMQQLRVHGSPAMSDALLQIILERLVKRGAHFHAACFGCFLTLRHRDMPRHDTAQNATLSLDLCRDRRQFPGDLFAALPYSRPRRVLGEQFPKRGQIVHVQVDDVILDEGEALP